MDNARVIDGACRNLREKREQEKAVAERRESPRIECNHWARIAYDKSDQGLHSLPALCVDESDSGYRLLVTKPIPVGNVTVYVSKEQGTCPAQVVYCEPTDGDRFAVGCKFLSAQTRHVRAKGSAADLSLTT